MATFFLIISAICFIATWGIHMIADLLAQRDATFYCGYMSIPWMRTIPWISGFGLAVIPETIVLGLAWYWVFLINIPITLVFGFLCTNIIMRRFATGKGAGLDILISLLVGIITLVIGLIIQ